MAPPIIPERSSSLRKAHSEKALALKKSREALKRARSELSDDAEGTRRCKVRIFELEVELEGIEERQASLDAEEAEQKLDIADYRAGHRRANKEKSSLVAELWDARRELFKMEEQLGVREKISPDGHAAFNSLLMRLYHDPQSKKSQRPPSEQSQLRKASIKYYGSDIGAPHGKLWCPFTKDYWDKEDMRCAHIAPYRLRDELAGYIFGGDNGTRLNRVENTLMVKYVVEECLDNRSFVLIPVDLNEDPRRTWKIKVTGTSGVHRTLGKNDEQLHCYDGQTLEFKNENRPASRFLYFHFIMVISLAARDRVPGYPQILADLPRQKPFATRGKYLRHSMLIALAKEAGNLSGLPDNEYQKLLGEPGMETYQAEDKVTNEEESRVAQLTIEATCPEIADEEDEAVEDDGGEDDAKEERSEGDE